MQFDKTPNSKSETTKTRSDIFFFFEFSKKRDTLKSYIVLFFIQKVSTVIVISERGYKLSRSQNDKLLTFDNLFPSLLTTF